METPQPIDVGGFDLVASLHAGKELLVANDRAFAITASFGYPE
jgi:hypothetical protein